jgi:hypothetical protein
MITKCSSAVPIQSHGVAAAPFAPTRYFWRSTSGINSVSELDGHAVACCHDVADVVLGGKWFKHPFAECISLRQRPVLVLSR